MAFVQALDVARGLEYMHEDSGLGVNGVAHGALNPSNVLIKDSSRAVISGFGHAKVGFRFPNEQRTDC